VGHSAKHPLSGLSLGPEISDLATRRTLLVEVVDFQGIEENYILVLLDDLLVQSTICTNNHY